MGLEAVANGRPPTDRDRQSIYERAEILVDHPEARLDGKSGSSAGFRNGALPVRLCGGVATRGTRGLSRVGLVRPPDALSAMRSHDVARGRERGSCAKPDYPPRLMSARRLMLGLLPHEWSATMEVESRCWILRCPCSHERSWWDAGGIRWKAAGHPQRLLRCPDCNQTTWHTMYKKDSLDIPVDHAA